MKKIYTFAFLFLIALMLYQPGVCLYYSLQGLNLWFEKMVPALFPFMILSGVIVKMELTGDMVASCAPVLQPLFRVSRHVIYGILIGFLCGFPMGAKVAVQLLEGGKITRPEAEYLLSFCNNIGPIYFLSFVLPTIGVKNVWIPLAGMYLLPLVYGLTLRHTWYRKKIPYEPIRINRKNMIVQNLPHTGTTQTGRLAGSKMDLLWAVDTSIKDAINSIVVLGGYMILFNALNLVPGALLPTYSEWLAPVLEITGGIGRIGAANPFYVLCLLPLGGLSCIAQTYSIISKAGLALNQYLFHKLALSGITVLYYIVFI